jgi:hypothetical protein
LRRSSLLRRIQQVMGDMGAQGEPQVTVAELKGFPVEF